MDSVCARISRAVADQPVTPITMMTAMIRGTVGGNTTARTIASGRYGMTRNHSVNRLRMPPVGPRKWPEPMPIRVPITIAITVAQRPTSSEMRLPQITIVSTDRPALSVPNG